MPTIEFYKNDIPYSGTLILKRTFLSISPATEIQYIEVPVIEYITQIEYRDRKVFDDTMVGFNKEAKQLVEDRKLTASNQTDVSICLPQLITNYLGKGVSVQEECIIRVLRLRVIFSALQTTETPYLDTAIATNAEIKEAVQAYLQFPHYLLQIHRKSSVSGEKFLLAEVPVFNTPKSSLNLFPFIQDSVLFIPYQRELLMTVVADGSGVLTGTDEIHLNCQGERTFQSFSFSDDSLAVNNA